MLTAIEAKNESKREYTSKVLFTPSIVSMIKRGDLTGLTHKFHSIRKTILDEGTDLEYELFVLSIHVETCCKILASKDLEAIEMNRDYITGYLGGLGWKAFTH